MSLILLTLGDTLDRVFYSFDMWVFNIFGSIQSSFMTVVAKFFTTFGDEAFMVPIVVVSIVLCFFKKTRKYGFTLLFSIIIGSLITNVIAKPAILRIRPYNTLQSNSAYWSWYIGAGALSESDYSFPSGHTTGAVEMAVAMFLCLRSDGKKKIAWVFPVLAFGTMCSRIYLMVHYPSDVVGGLIVGIIAGSLGYLLAKLVMKTPVDKVDAEKLFKKVDEKKRNKIGTAVITVAVLGIFLYAFIPSLSEGGTDVQRCAYATDSFTCYNKAKVDDEDYPAIDGKNYCKIHWKELSGADK
ncbi:MAG: phosphatase PAP2 family protein [Eubacteriales bacterium]|nr:phosphatase PAP2 family protein [Eubacteriales bacterium]